MKIELNKIKIKDLFEGYKNSEEEGIFALNGRLNIRPPYQREFIYDDKKQEAVIDSILKGYPLNVMYWGVTPQGFEIIDGQQRTMSICNYLSNNFAYFFKYFHNLSSEEQDKILNYEIQVYICDGTEQEKLKWFETINIAGVELTKQELRNAVYSSPWVSDAKKYFSKSNCPAYRIGKDYLSGDYHRQFYLETAIKWISNNTIDSYMALHSKDNSALPLYNYFTSIINWTKAVFPNYRKEMKGIEWGFLYNKYKDLDFNSEEIEKEVSKLMTDSDVQKKKGIYEYIFDHQEKHLSIRTFDDNTKRTVYEKQLGICPICGNHFEIEEMEADHITPWSEGGHTTINNCQMLCKSCNRTKSNK